MVITFPLKRVARSWALAKSHPSQFLLNESMTLHRPEFERSTGMLMRHQRPGRFCTDNAADIPGTCRNNNIRVIIPPSHSVNQPLNSESQLLTYLLQLLYYLELNKNRILVQESPNYIHETWVSC